MNTKPPSSYAPVSHEAIVTCEIILKWYKLNSRNLSDEEVLPRLNIQTLMRVLGNPDWNQVYHCWAINARHMSRLQPFVSHAFDKDKFVYFIEVYKNQITT
ncbi:MAG TPA: hypothetical protein ENJ08_04330 [Gammaproteobacteria bacterium]|nr:hypothetical protein [Gammaproteobacteria bacterium]